jgi:hypothetical protein
MRVQTALVAMLLLLALVPARAQDTAAAGDKARQSGFLTDYSQLKPAADREGVLLYVAPGANFKPYKKIFLHPIEVYVSPSAEYKGIQPAVLQRMTDQFAAAFKSALAPQFEVVAAPGPDVLEVRTAITGVAPVKPGLTPVDFLPLKAVFNVGRAAVGKEPLVAELSAEMEVLDPQKRRLAAAVATRKGDKTLQQGEQITWQHMQAISESWAKSFRARLDEWRGAPGR